MNTYFFAPGIVVMMSTFFSGSGVMGLPPGERDVLLAQCPPADAVLYAEWSERSAGKAGAKGIDGLAADPEVRAFFKDLETAILALIEKKSANSGPEAKVLAKVVPQIVKILLNRPGCLSVSLDEKIVGKIVGPPGPAQMMAVLAAVRATVVINAGKDADKLAKQIEALLALLPAEARKKGLNRQVIPVPPPIGKLILHRHNKYFILAFGKGALDQALAGLTGKSKGLLGNPRFVAAAKKVAFRRTATVAWIDVKTAIGKAVSIFGEPVQKVVKIIGGDSIQHLMTSAGVIDGEVHTRTFIGTNGKTEGILALLSGRAIKPADLSHVPADSDLVFTVSVNAPKILATVRKIVAIADPASKDFFEKLLKQFEEELGLKIEMDLFAAFGDVWVFHDSKSAGGFFLTSLVGSLEIRDPQKAEDVFTKLMDVLEEQLPGETRPAPRRRGIFLEKKIFMGTTIYYVNSIGGDAPFAPAFCLTNKHLLVAPHPQALKAHLRFQKSKQARFPSRFGKDLKMPKGELICYSYFESKRMLRLVYAFVPYFGQMILSQTQRSGMKMDIFSITSARGILPYFGDSTSSVVRTKDGILAESKNGAPMMGGGVIMMVPMFWLNAVGSVRESRAIERQPRPAKRVVPRKKFDKKLNLRQGRAKKSLVAILGLLRSLSPDRVGLSKRRSSARAVRNDKSKTVTLTTRP
ncbi:MAG: hypothetical protein IID45_08590 [Planctomycetes bacterium]|nr:hypothetical protein [Planctomycetota bacterium]